MSKIYTKTGDKGETSLLGGQRVPKNHPQVETYGTLDELGAHMGLVYAMAQEKGFKDVCGVLDTVFTSLFVMESHLAVGEDYSGMLPPFSSDAIGTLERSIDTMSEQLPELKRFVRAGASVLSAQCHIARTVCRRAERCLVSIHWAHPVEETLFLSYINRLSDYLFTLSRYVLKLEGIDEQTL